MRLRKVLLGLATATPLAVSGCSLRGDASCLVFSAPSREIRGTDAYSQRWADETIERGVAGCNWPRPKAAAGA